MGKEELESLIARIDVWLLVFGIIVVIGVAGESIFGIRHWWNSRKLQELQRSENRTLQLEIARLDNMTAEANARAAQATLFAEQLAGDVAARTMSESQQAAVTMACLKFAGRRIRLGSFTGDAEAFLLAQQIGVALQAADIEVTDQSGQLGIRGGALIGVLVEGPDNEKDLVKGLLRALELEGKISVVPANAPTAPDTPVSIIVGTKGYVVVKRPLRP